MKNHIFCCILTLCFALAVCFLPVLGQAAPTPCDMEVLRLINEQRAARGLCELIMDSRISEAAAIRAEETSQFFSHDRPDGSDCLTVFADIGMTCSTSGENLTTGMEMPAGRAVENWLDSPDHLDNILYAPFTHTGIAHYTAQNGRVYWVQLFAAPISGMGEAVTEIEEEED